MTLLEQVGRIGPYFAVRTGSAGAGPPAGFRPLRELYDGGPDGPLAARIAEVARRMGTAEPRVAASTVHLGLAARLWSVALGTAALGAAVPDLHPDLAHWALPAEGPLDLWLPHPVALSDGPPADALHQAVITENLAPLAAAVRAVTPIAEPLLHGNTASALAGTLKVLAMTPALRRTLALPAAEALVRDLLDRPPLRGTGTLSAPGEPFAFRRTSCCLYYRAPGSWVCGDCVFDRPPARRR
ncbi:(2Fe-2S)-binding protein [Kitasatospora sp. KL5]|uniref:(2Fe-2S)-binding protein n=1 Tax=Kitasatospora sp. KL5 TaxID=3425125 RepID=UPI003D6EE1C0